MRRAFELVGGGRASARGWNGATFVASGDAFHSSIVTTRADAIIEAEIRAKSRQAHVSGAFLFGFNM